MNLDPKWVPMKWPCGPLEWARRSKGKKPDAGLKETLDAWAQPAALEILKGTPVNCLVVEWADGAPEDAAQQEALKPLVEAGRAKGISFVGTVAAKDVAAAAAVRACRGSRCRDGFRTRRRESGICLPSCNLRGTRWCGSPPRPFFVLRTTSGRECRWTP